MRCKAKPSEVINWLGFGRKRAFLSVDCDQESEIEKVPKNLDGIGKVKVNV